MTIDCTTAITIGQIQKIKCLYVDWKDEELEKAIVHLAAIGGGGKRYPNPSVDFALLIQNGNGTADKKSHKLKVITTPSGFDNAIVVVGEVEIVNGFTNLVTAFRAAANNLGAQRRAVETVGLADGWIDVLLTGAVT